MDIVDRWMSITVVYRQYFGRNMKVNAARNLHKYVTDTYVRPWKQGLELELSMAVRNVDRVCYAQCVALLYMSVGVHSVQLQ